MELARWVVVPDLAPQVNPHGVVPPGGGCPLEEGGAAARADEPAGRGVIPLIQTAGPGLPPQWLAPLFPPHGGIWAGVTREEELGVPPLRGLAHSGPLGSKLGASRERNGGDPDNLVFAPVTAVSTAITGPR